MTLDKARQLLATQASFGGGYNRNAARLILAEVERAHGTQAVERLIRELQLDAVFGIAAEASFAAKRP